MDALSDLLRAVKLNGAVFLEARMTAPWCVISKSGVDSEGVLSGLDHVVFFHIITEGHCRARLLEGGEAVDLHPGDLILLPQDDPHLMASDLHLHPVPVENLVQPAPPGGLMRIDYGGGGAEVQLRCGFFSCDTQLSRPLLDALPRILRMPLGDEPTAAWFLQMLRQGAQETSAPRAGTGTVIAKLSELMFVDAVRRYMESLPESQKGWLAGLRDRHVGRALSLMHGQPANDWTVNNLASEVGLSRSAFTQRFADLLDQPPMQYLSRWRLSLAADQLRHSGRAIGMIAQDARYDSEAAFNRAFKREFGTPPASWRRQRRGETHAVSGT